MGHITCLYHSLLPFWSSCCCCWVTSVVSNLCDPIDGSPPGSPIPGILQARTLEWVAISFSNAWKWKVKVKSFSRVRLLATPWTAAHQAPPSMGFSRQEYWSGVSLPSLYFGHMSTLNILECSWYKNLHGEIFWMLSNSILYWDNWIPFSPLPHVYIRYFKVFWIVCQNTAFVEY